MRTRLTDVLQIEHPVMLAGMGGVSYSRLVAAVSEAGGFGRLGGSTMGGDGLGEEIRAAKKGTAKPIRLDLLTTPPRRPAGRGGEDIGEGGAGVVGGVRGP